MLWYMIQLIIITIVAYFLKSKVITKSNFQKINTFRHFGPILTLILDELCFMRDVGIEILTTKATGQTSRQFIPSSKVRNLIIYEHVTPWMVQNLMGILVHKVDQIVLAFNYELGL